MTSRPLNLRDIKITDPFWTRNIRLIRKEVIPYQWEILNDRVPEAAPSYCIHNFKVAAELNRKKHEQGSSFKEPVYTFRGFEALPADPRNPRDDEFYGFVFQDSDLYKWLEAVGYQLAVEPDPELEKTADEAIDLICAAQSDNGYLDTYYIINGMDRCFTDLRDHHELYCLGHLIEGAVSYYTATGKDKILKAACRYADLVAETFGPEEGKLKGYPGHEIAEMALFRLSDVTGEEKYARLAEYFIDQRGQQPLYFDSEHPQDPAHYKVDYYHQAHIPVREQDEAVGHAVRAVYLYSGMADMARKSCDAKLLAACDKLWNSVTNEKMYITGGIGATHLGEAFSFPFDLPNDTAYAETCASIGLVFWARRMLEIRADRKYSDVMELALYNGILSGIALDGKSFFYVNPLEVLPVACHNDERKFHVKSTRQKWFGCACCPPNIARLVSSIGSYAFTESDDTLFIHLYMGAELSKNGVSVSIDSSLPDSGSVKITTSNPGSAALKLALRIPSWSRDTVISGASVSDGYMYIDVPSGDNVISFELDMTPRFVAADNRVTEDIGKIAVVRGPVVYCAEEADNGTSLASLKVLTDSVPSEEITSEFGSPVTALKVKGMRSVSRGGSEYVSGLYKEFGGISSEPVDIRLVPYRLWANRGEGEMRVFLEC